METMEFNLLQERWVRVRTQDCTVQEVSLTDALLHAHAYVDLAGEMPTQDAAMLRLQLAVLHTVFSRVDGNGVPAPFEEPRDALQRWSELWQLGHFPEQPIRDYLDKWQDRFWLFHPERPFWQVPEAKIGSPFGAKKLNGEVFESENKTSLFSACAGTGKESMDYPQAARWLVSLNNYDDAAAKKKAKDRPLPSMGPGWLGRIGVIYVKGSNLFETLMRNLMFLQDGGELWEPDVPCWELEDARSGERTEVACPDNFAELMTTQFRRILLERKENKVVGYTVLGGDFFDSTNALLDHLHHHLGSCDDACRLSHVAAGLQRQKDLQCLVCDHDVFQRRSDPHLPAHQQSGFAGFHVGGHSAGSIQRVEHDHCPYLLSRHPA